MDIRGKAVKSPNPSGWRKLFEYKIVIIWAICFVFCVSAAAFLLMEREITLDVNGQAQQVVTHNTKVADILQENNIAIYEGDLVEPDLSSRVKNQDTIKIVRAFDFNVFADGKKMILRSTPLSVQEALAKANLTLEEMDQVSMPLDKIISKPEDIIVSRVDVQYITRQVAITAPVEVKRDSSLAQGKTKVIQEGKNGLKEEVLAIYTKDGQELTRKVTESKVLQEAQAKVVAQGAMKVASRSSRTTATAAKSSIANKSTNPSLAGKEVKYVTAYAYTGGGTTATGTKARVGVIAVDPSVIPLGTKVYVEGYGYATAEDTGSAIKGNKIDLYMNSRAACINWGVKKVKIYILK
ncbi:MAG: 3D domain-containing protein [Bacillota bacterium]|jgi:uncharacterized protein YabE (DUF348 family)